MQGSIREAINVLNQGGIVIYPTDTAFGIGCRIDKQEAVKKLFELRKRPESQATPVLVDSLSMAGDYWIEIPDGVQNKLITQYWPGALTIVLPCRIEKVNNLVCGGGGNIGLRMPDHDTALKLISGAGVPILSPSANFHGDKTPYEFDDLDSNLLKLVDFVVPGACKTKLASTVIDCSVSPWKIIREGAVQLANSI